MNRTLVLYDGVEYTVVGDGPDELRRRIEQNLTTRPVMWLEANRGEGRRTRALLMVTPGTPIAIIAESEGRAEGTDPGAILDADDLED
jgi:hypothetical protein